MDLNEIISLEPSEPARLKILVNSNDKNNEGSNSGDRNPVARPLFGCLSLFKH